jgi:hypothetical protein
MRFLIAMTLFAFSSYSAWVVKEFGYMSVFYGSLSSHPTSQVLFDLIIAGGLLALLMIADNQRQGRPFMKAVPFLLTTVALGSIGPLLYFLIYPEGLTATVNAILSNGDSSDERSEDAPAIRPAAL